jgi:hypothetical protein
MAGSAVAFESFSPADSQNSRAEAITPPVTAAEQTQVFGATRSANAEAVAARENSGFAGGTVDFASQKSIYAGEPTTLNGSAGHGPPGGHGELNVGGGSYSSGGAVYDSGKGGSAAAGGDFGGGVGGGGGGGGGVGGGFDRSPEQGPAGGGDNHLPPGDQNGAAGKMPGAEVPMRSTDNTAAQSGSGGNSSISDGTIDFSKQKDIYASPVQASLDKTRDNQEVVPPAYEGASEKLPQLVGEPRDVTRVINGANGEMIETKGQEYDQPNGKVFVDAAVADKFTPETVNNLVNQIPNNNFNFEIMITDKPLFQGITDATGGISLGWFLKPEKDRAFTNCDVNQLRLEVGSKYQAAENGLDSQFREVALHEWVHEFAENNPDLHNQYLAAAEIEKNITGRQYGSTEEDNLTVHLGEEFLSQDKSRFDRLCDQTPLKAKVIAHIMESKFGAVEGEKTAGQLLIEERVKEANERTTGPALAKMHNRLIGWENRRDGQNTKNPNDGWFHLREYFYGLQQDQ